MAAEAENLGIFVFSIMRHGFGGSLPVYPGNTLGTFTGAKAADA
jgi:hypothetical protein